MFAPGKQYRYGLYLLARDKERIAALQAAPCYSSKRGRALGARVLDPRRMGAAVV